MKPVQRIFYQSCVFLAHIFAILLFSQPLFAAPSPLTTGEIDFNTVSLKSMTEVTVSLSSGENLTILGSAIAGPSPEQYSWLGTISGDDKSQVVFSVVDSYLFGSMQSAERVWEVSLDGSGDSPVQEYPPDEWDVILEDTSELDLRIFKDNFESPPINPESRVASTAADPVLNTCNDQPNEIDILVIYSPQVASKYQNLDELKSKVNHAFSVSNQVFRTSNILIEGKELDLNLVALEEFDFDDVKSCTSCPDILHSWQLLESIATRGILPWGDLYEKRMIHSADLVVAISDTVGRGRAYSSQISSLNEEMAWAVVPHRNLPKSGQIKPYRSFANTFTHEIGHLFGARHDRYSLILPDGLLTGSGYGYTALNASPPWSSVMAYQQECWDFASNPVACYKRGVFSNPNINDSDGPLGANDANNAAQLISIAPQIACYRSDEVGPTVGEITFLDANLEACVLSQASPDTPVSSVTSLNCEDRGISQLDGLENFTSLTSLALTYNSIVVVSPLETLTSLEFLKLSLNDIVDVGPLASLINLRELELSQNEILVGTVLSPLTNLNLLYLNGNKLSCDEILAVRAIFPFAVTDAYWDDPDDGSPVSIYCLE